MPDTTLADRVRPDFPVFERRVAGRPIAFFDGPGGSQVPAPVAEAVARYLTHHNANTHGRFATSEESDAAIQAGRTAMADFLGAESPREVVFGANMTTLTFALSRALGRGWKGRGGEVVVTELDHQANVAPWRAMAQEHGMTVRVVPLDRETLTLDYGALEGMLGPDTRLVAVGAASNAIGTVNDVRRVTSLARQAGALSFVDAVHYAPHQRVDVGALGCDFLACSAYKFFGPHVGILWGRRDLLEEVAPFKVPPAGDEAPERWETGTQNHEGIAGTAAAVDWIAALDPQHGECGRRAALDGAYAVLHAHETRLFARLWDGLGEIGGVRRYGLPAHGRRTPTAAFTVAGRTPDEVAAALGREGVFVWNGNFYATTVTEALGVEESGGMLRAGVAPYTTDDDVARLLDGVRRLATG